MREGQSLISSGVCGGSGVAHQSLKGGVWFIKAPSVFFQSSRERVRAQIALQSFVVLTTKKSVTFV